MDNLLNELIEAIEGGVCKGLDDLLMEV